MTNTTKRAAYHGADKLEPRADAALARYRDLTDPEIAVELTRRAVALHRALADGTYDAAAHALGDWRDVAIKVIVDEDGDLIDELRAKSDSYLIGLAASAARRRASKPARVGPTSPTGPGPMSSRADQAPEHEARRRMLESSSTAWARTTSTTDAED